MTEQTPAPNPPNPPYPPNPPNPPYPPPYNLYAILSLIFSVAVLPPVGVYLGYKAKQQIEQTGERGIELAQVGIIVGWIFTAFFAVFILVWCGMFGMMMASFRFTDFH